jgi:hypothetical protein
MKIITLFSGITVTAKYMFVGFGHVEVTAGIDQQHYRPTKTKLN